MEREEVSTKSRLTATVLCWFLGTFGVHRFYVGKKNLEYYNSCLAGLHYSSGIL